MRLSRAIRNNRNQIIGNESVEFDAIEPGVNVFLDADESEQDAILLEKPNGDDLVTTKAKLTSYLRKKGFGLTPFSESKNGSWYATITGNSTTKISADDAEFFEAE